MQNVYAEDENDLWRDLIISKLAFPLDNRIGIQN